MTLESFLAPGENIEYSSPTTVKYQGSRYFFYITNKRLIWYARAGSLIKRDKFVCEALDEVTNISFKEEGMLVKKGVIEITMGERKIQEFHGPIETIKAIYTEAQALLKTKKKVDQTTSSAPKVVVTQVTQSKEDPKEKKESKKEAPKKIEKVQSPLDILKTRYAKGEISEEEFLKKKKDLS